MECVTYARRHSRVELRGDAWRWWNAARGVYDRGHRPAPGAVLVLKRQRGSLGHLAVVRRIVNARLILADHANWLNRGRGTEHAGRRRLEEGRLVPGADLVCPATLGHARAAYGFISATDRLPGRTTRGRAAPDGAALSLRAPRSFFVIPRKRESILTFCQGPPPRAKPARKSRRAELRRARG